MSAKISEKEYVISNGVAEVTLEVDMDTYALTLNSMPFALTSWKIGDNEYGLDEKVTVSNDQLVSDEDGVWLDVVGQYKSAYSIILFADTDGTIIKDGAADGRFDRVIRTKKESIGLELPGAFKSEEGVSIPKPDEVMISSEGRLDMVGWQDEDTGMIVGTGATLNVSRRGVIILTPLWKQVYIVPRIATVQFITGERGTLLDEDGNYKQGWCPPAEGSDDSYKDPNAAYLTREGDKAGQGTFSFRVDSTAFKIPETIPDYIPPMVPGPVEGSEVRGQIRYMSHWIRTDGGTITQSDNPTNKGFAFAEGSAGLTEGDGYADIFYPGDVIPLRVGEVITLRPVWTVAYTHSITYDLTQAKPSEGDSAEVLAEKEKYKDRIIEWMIQHGISPDYDDEGRFKWTGSWKHIGPRRTHWTRMPSTNPPYSTYFQIWVAESPMLDISTKYTYGGKKLDDVKAQYNHICESLSKESESNIRVPPSLSVCGLQPCTSQRVGLMAEEDSHEYICNLVAVWNQWGDTDQSDFPNISIVYDDPEWEVPLYDGGHTSSLTIPPSTWFTGVECYDTDNNGYRFYLDMFLFGTGKQVIGDMIDARPRSGGEDVSVKLFEDWNVRIGGFSAGVSHKVPAGSTIRIIVTGNIASSYYWGQFPGPGWIGGTPEGITNNTAYDFFTDGYTEEEKSSGITWEMIQDKKAIWGPLYQENIAEGIMTIVPVETIGVPEVVLAEANWRKKSGAYLIRGDYVGSSTTDSVAPGMLDLGFIQSVEDTISANLTEIPTVAYGFENQFVMDLGTVRRLNLKVARSNPANYDDAMSPAIDDMEYLDDDGKVIPPDSDKHPGNKDKYFYSSYWSNSRWYSELREALNFWQNSQSESGSQLGGFQIFMESPPDEETRAGDVTGLSVQTGNRPLYPSFLYNVFMTGSMSPSYDGQLLTVTIPMTLSRMISSESEEGTKDANRLCVLNPGNTYPRDMEGTFYIDSIKASTLYATMSSNTDGTWAFEAPTKINGWSCSRQYYKGSIGETIPSDETKVGKPASLTISRWKVCWEDSLGDKFEQDYYAGSMIALGTPENPVYMATLTATWAPVKETVILDAEQNMRYILDDISSEEGSTISPDDSICGRYYVLKAPLGLTENGWRIQYTVSGGGGRGGPKTVLGSSRNGVMYRHGGGGGSGQHKTGMAALKETETHIAVYVGRGGGAVGASDDGNGESTIVYAIEGGIDLDEKIQVMDSIAGLTHRTLVIAQGGNAGGELYGGSAMDENNTIVEGMAKGGDASTSYSVNGDNGDQNGLNSGGAGGKSSSAIQTKTQGGGGGGAGGVSFTWLLPGGLGEYSIKSIGGDGAGLNSSSTKGTYGGGGGGDNSPGGMGFASIHFC